MISCASRSLTEVERRYSQTKKEALALVWACERFHLFLYGINFDLVTDHKALETIYSPWSKLSARIEPYNFKVKYVPWPVNIADSLSRRIQKEEVAETRNVAEEYIRFVAQKAAPRAVSIHVIERKSGADKELEDVGRCVATGD